MPDLEWKPDGFESVFSNAFNKMIGVEFRQFVDVAFSDGVLVLAGTLTARTLAAAEEACARLVRGPVQAVDGAGVASQDAIGADRAIGSYQSRLRALQDRIDPIEAPLP